MLIHQTDVFLFKNELQQWCEKNYDYIGAPWFRPDKLNPNFVSAKMQQLKLVWKKNKVYANRHNKTGNGGLSLRCIRTALEVLDVVKPTLIKKYRESASHEYNEDIFWSLEAPAVLTGYRTPGLEEALHFAIEFEPEKAFAYINRELPFGCHAPLKHHPDFWRKFIPVLMKDNEGEMP
ncbi:hypothetical protein D9M68_697450 [compost metagenome]